jgi:peptide/nickel transport system ATP-binding protein
LAHLPSGCTFHPRCPLFEDGLCDATVPQLTTIRAGQSAACHVVARDGVPEGRPDEPGA